MTIDALTKELPVVDRRNYMELNVPRQTGKTETLIELALQYQEVFYVTLNNRMEKYIKESAPRGYKIKTIPFTDIESIYNRIRGCNINNYIIILDEVSLDLFFSELELKCVASYNILMENANPIFSVNTRRLFSV